jgi:glycosyltransferase involved in cell wall biosynthesis
MHVHGLSDYWCMKCAKKYGIKKIIFHVHNMKKEQEDNRSLKNILRNFYYSKGLNLVDVRMACSVEAAKSHFNNKTYTVINNAIDVEKYKLDFEKRRLYRNMFDVKNEKIFVHIGRMVKDKNYPFLINVFSEIHQIYPNAKFLLVGDGPEKGHVLELVKTAGIESNVVLLGIRNDIDCILQAADGMLLPSHTEGFGIVAIEAQASGLPCLISQNVPNSVMITPVAKQMNNNHSPREWAVAMVDLISNERQDQTTKVISAGFDSKGEADKLFMKYEELVNG